jgi:UDP-N-acetylglucosamine 2-epimerase (non-hydrolysing)
MIIFGTRPEAIKLAPVVLEMQRNGRGLVPFVCVTGQHHEMLNQVLSWFQIAPDRNLRLMQKNQGLAEFAGRAMLALSGVLKGVKPDLVLVQGDTTTAMIASMAAFYSRIPVGHVEAGLRTRDLHNPFPEEMNRRVIGITANLHFAPTEGAADALIREQVDPSTVFVVGNTVIDALRLTMERRLKCTCL